MLDNISLIMWSVTYILIIISSVKYRHLKQVCIPYNAGIFNLCWETNALIVSKGFWGHIAWFSLDAVILLFTLYFFKSKRLKLGYTFLLILGMQVFYYLFQLPDGMLISSFVIDFLMSVFYLISRDKLSPHYKIPIAITKLIGDASAGLYYGGHSSIVLILSILVFICNLLYLCICLEESTNKKGRKLERIKSC